MILKLKRWDKCEEGERRELNPRMMESQPIGVTVCLHPPVLCITYIVHVFTKNNYVYS